MSSEIRKILIANRGEIAVRVMRTCRALGIATVAVFSDADAGAPHVRFADEAVRIGPAPSAESYLAIDRLIDAATRTGANAIHPGYGFLAENGEFAEACAAAGLIFIGPGVDAIRSMGSKQRAKGLARKAGVPVVPGYDGEDQADAALVLQSKRIGFPVLIKASAGGGGKGMRVVEDPDGVQEAIDAARRESMAAFGDDTLLIEKYVQRPRHVEIQILGDHHGNIVHLFERECSIQRRHQKIIEESPSPALEDDLRQRMGQAAVAIAKEIGYRNAGTVEFIVTPEGAFYFLEVNTRLQVEHPVTECVTGIDLVAEQIRVAEGQPLGYGQGDLTQTGAAIECRLYAEDPANGFLPSIGRLEDWHIPDWLDLRVDTGVCEGSDVSIHYDPMLAKLITQGKDRDEAIRRMQFALQRISVQGVLTNRQFLLDVLSHPAFRAGDLDTHFIDHHLAQWPRETDTRDATERALVAATLAAQASRDRDAQVLPAVPRGFRNNPYQDQWQDWTVANRLRHVSYRQLRDDRFRVALDGVPGPEVRRTGWAPPELALEYGGVLRRYRVTWAGERCFVHETGFDTVLQAVARFPDRVAGGGEGGYRAPMPGKIIEVRVASGDEVSEGQTLMILEAMKMEQSINASAAGVVAEVLVRQGDQVDADAVLITFEA